MPPSSQAAMRLPPDERAQSAVPVEPAPLLPAVARGDGLAVRRCIERYGPLVWSIARRWSPRTADAEDAAQEAFVELWRCAHRYDATRGSERVFVATIARRRLVDRLRRQRVRGRFEGGGLDEAALAVAHEGEDERCAEAEIARAALAALPAPQRRVIELSVVDGLSHAEVAARTAMPLGTVKTLIRRGLMKVRQALGAGAGAAAGQENAP